MRAPAAEHGRRRSTGTPRSSPATRPTTAGTSGCSCASSRPGWPTGPTVAGRLVPQRRDPGPRAGRGRRPPLLALRRAGREARPRPVVPADHEVRRRAARLHRHRLAGADPGHADQLDRAQRGRRGRLPQRARHAPRRRRRDPRLHDPPGHALRGDLHGPGPGAPAGREARPRRTSAPVVAAYVAQAGRETEIERLSHRAREDRRLPRRRRHQPGQRRADPDLDRRLRAGRLRHRRDHGRARPRRARLRLRPPVRPADPRGHPAGRTRRRGGPSSTTPTSRRPPTTSSSTPGRYNGMAAPEAIRADHRRPGRPGARARRPSPTGSATGSSAASATGARRSRSSTATAAASCRCPTTSCRSGCRRRSTTRARARTRCATTRPSWTRPARAAAARPGARPTRWTRSSTRPGTGSATSRPGTRTGPVDRALVDRWTPGRPVHRRRRARRHAPALLALLHQGDGRLRPRRPPRAVPAALQPGPGPGRRRRADEQVARQRRGSRTSSSPATAPTPCASS